MDNGQKIPNVIFPEPNVPAVQDMILSQDMNQTMRDAGTITLETKAAPAVNMGEIGGKVMKGALGNNATEIVENGMAELKKDPAGGYEAIQEAREKFARGEI